MLLLLKTWWQTAITLFIGYVRSVVRSGLHHPVGGWSECKVQKQIRHQTFAVQNARPFRQRLPAEGNHERSREFCPQHYSAKPQVALRQLALSNRGLLCRVTILQNAIRLSALCIDKFNSMEAIYSGEWDHPGQPSADPASSHHLAWWSNTQRGSWQQSIGSCTNQSLLCHRQETHSCELPLTVQTCNNKGGINVVSSVFLADTSC